MGAHKILGSRIPRIDFKQALDELAQPRGAEVVWDRVRYGLVQLLCIGLATACAGPESDDRSTTAQGGETDGPETITGRTSTGTPIPGETGGSSSGGDPDTGSSAPGNDSGDDSAGSGELPDPSAGWKTFELTCPQLRGLGEYEERLVELASDVPAGAIAQGFVLVDEDIFRLNPSYGASSLHDPIAESVSLACGHGNGLRAGVGARVSLAYPPGTPDTTELRWDLHEVTCPRLDDLGTFEERMLELATGIDPDFVSAHYMGAGPDAERWAPRPNGRASYLTSDGALMIACGNGNAHRAGSTVRVGFGYPAASRPELQRLRWESHAFECPNYPDLTEYEEVPTVAATDIEPGFVASSYSISYDGTWVLAPLTGYSWVEVG